jgi:peptidoglycan hydrolase-like protein with peptidoglycan-binding domain
MSVSEHLDEISLDDLPLHDPDFTPCEEGTDSPVAFGLIGSTHKPLTWLEEYFQKWGVRYRVVSGWQTRGRATGSFNPRGVLNHHTGSTSSASNPNPSLRTLIEGRSDLAGPLCQVSTGYDGVTTIIAAGRANHAGTAKAAAGVPAGDGNALWVANEIATNGTQKMPQVQYDAVVLVNVAMLDGLNATAVALHHTTSLSGKWDLGAGTGKFGVPYSVTKLRADVTARLKAGPPNAAPRTTLRPGDRGDDVKALQRLLNTAGAAIDVDGSYGPATEAAVRTFQKSAGLLVDGIAGPQTQAALTTSPEEDDMPTAAEIATEVWTRPVKDAQGTVHTTGAALGIAMRHSIAATLAARDAARDAAVARALAEAAATAPGILTKEDVATITASTVAAVDAHLDARDRALAEALAAAGADEVPAP